ncbi:hypothetical protein DID88_000923 [Monilinia fructigena]|uniref:GTPase-activating protein GYP5 n=1 Tax=Monilinia fructigena TaxID=38457 RepID=A0A395IYM5_9HELO|nr:hypothetical protein DID88_000923 [Monilinia fructigena]
MSDHEHQKHLSDSEDDSIMEEKEQKVDQSSDIESDTFEDANDVEDIEDTTTTSPVERTSLCQPALAPGTASGVSAGPSAMGDPEAPVDWDLCRMSFYEGPAAVARTSAEELNHAIATGIPHAIRGVVWQVLAESKNEELEVLYRNLDMPGLHKHLYQFERLLEDSNRRYIAISIDVKLHLTLYATQWFLTLFAYRFPLQLVLRIYDLILSEGLEAILKFGIVLMQKNAAHLLTLTDMAALTTFLKDRLFDVYIDASPSAGSILESGFFGNSGASIDKEVYRADHMIQDACAVKITPKMLENNTLNRQTLLSTHKVRRLEERVESHDTEHAALATELVRTKVENQEIQEENETIKEQVKELKNVINRLPEEIEAKLQSEMDRLMKRNQEVHEENQKLEDEMNEMEQNLVETKMKYAEINAAHEALNRKWTDLRKALGD